MIAADDTGVFAAWQEKELMTTPPARTAEYDRFGPWVDEVTSLEEMPRLYRDFPVDLDAARLVLKVPRNITRRDANPAMDLYDHVLVLRDQALTVLSRDVVKEGAFSVREIALDEIAAIHDVANLLDASLTIIGVDGTVLTVGYNGSARESLARLLDALRSGGRETQGALQDVLLGDGADGGAARLDVGPDDLSLISDLRDASRRVPDLRALAWHGRRRVALRPAGAAGWPRSLGHALSPATLQGAIIAGDARALEVFSRHAWLVRGNRPVLSASRLILPFAALHAVRVSPHPLYEAVSVAQVTAGSASVQLVVPDASSAQELLARAQA